MKVRAIDRRTIFIPCNMVTEFIEKHKTFPYPWCKIDGEEYYTGSVVHYDSGIELELISKNVREINIEEI